jgi:hypothetical protein
VVVFEVPGNGVRAGVESYCCEAESSLHDEFDGVAGGGVAS